MKNVIILGADGYLGWPMAMKFACENYRVTVVDNYLKRKIVADTDSTALIEGPRLKERSEIFQSLFNFNIEVNEGNCADANFMDPLIERLQPDAVVHFAEQPSAPYSMMGRSEATTTFNNNLNSTFNLIWSIVKYSPNTHIIKLGTMGEYGTPNIDIEEGWIDIEHNGRTQKFLYPRQASSLYHTTKILDTDLLWFYARHYNLRVTDLMQGPVYGIFTDESRADDRLLPNFHYDDIFGTVVNRFICQAVAGIPLTVFGAGGQTRGYLNIEDTMKCIALAASNPPKNGELLIYNQFTEQFSVNQLAMKVRRACELLNIPVEMQNIPNPRVEQENHYYNAKHTGLSDLGLVPKLMDSDVICEIMSKVVVKKDEISRKRALPRVQWKTS